MLKNKNFSIAKLIQNDQQNQYESATVIATGNKTVDIRMTNGGIYRHVPLTGSASIGDTVQVLFLKGRPTAMAGAYSGAASQVLIGSTGTTAESPTGDYAPSPHDALGTHHSWPANSANQFLATTLTAGQPAFRALALSDFQNAADGRYALKSTLITAGAGLTGTSSLSTNITLNVGAGNGIIANDDNIQVKKKTTSGLVLDGDGLAVGAGNGIIANDDNIQVKIKATVSGLVLDANGLAVGAGNGITVNNDNVQVKKKTTSGLVLDGDGLAVGAGDGITVNNANVQVKKKTTSGLVLDGYGLAVGAGKGITVNTSDIQIRLKEILDGLVLINQSGLLVDDAYGLYFNPRAGGGLQVLSDGTGILLNTSAGLSLSGGLKAVVENVGHDGTGLTVTAGGVSDNGKIRLTASPDPGQNASILASSSTGNLKLWSLTASNRVTTPLIDSDAGATMYVTPGQSLYLSPGSGKVLLAAAKSFQSDGYASQTTGMRVTSSGEADFRYVYADELHAKTFITDLEQALAGGQIISKSVAVLAESFLLPAPGDTWYILVRDLPSAKGMAVFEDGDYVGFKVFTRISGSLSIGWALGTVSSYIQNQDGTQQWLFTRLATNSGHGAGVVYADSVVLDFGKTGNGYHEINAIDGIQGSNSPYSQIVTWDTSPLDRTVRTRTGNLRGIFGSSLSAITYVFSYRATVGAVLAGQFAVIVNGVSTAGFIYTGTAIPYDASAATVKTAIEGIASIGSGNITSVTMQVSGDTRTYTIVVPASKAGLPFSFDIGKTTEGGLCGANPVPPATSNPVIASVKYNETLVSEYGFFGGTGTATTDRYFRASSAEVELRNVPLRLYAGGNLTTEISSYSAGSGSHGVSPYFAMGATLPSGPLAGNGIWMGLDSGSYKFRVGSISVGALNQGIYWDGSTLNVKGIITVQPGSNVVQTGGAAADVNANTTTISGGKVRTGLIQSTNYSTSLGSEFNLDDGTFKMGGSSSPKLSWSGTQLSIEGSLKLSGTIYATPSTAGLYADGTRMGYYNSGWRSYTDNTGDFFLRGPAGAQATGIYFDSATGLLSGGAWASATVPSYGAFTAQWSMSSSNGAITAAAGRVTIDSSGIILKQTAGGASSEIRAAMGNLSNIYGYGATATYGMAIGDPSNQFISVDNTNGIRIQDGTFTRFQVDGSGNLSIKNSLGTTVISLDNAGNSTIAGVLNIGSAGGFYQGTGSFASPKTGLKIWSSTANDVFTITRTATGGTFTVTVNGSTTTSQAYNVTAANLQAAIIALASVDAGEATVTLSSNVYTISFLGTLLGTNVTVSINTASLTGGTATLATVQSLNGRIAGYRNSSLSWYAGTDGTLYAGNGEVTLNESGIRIKDAASLESPDSENAITFGDLSSTAYAQIYSWGSGQLNIQSINSGGHYSSVNLFLGQVYLDGWVRAAYRGLTVESAVDLSNPWRALNDQVLIYGSNTTAIDQSGIQNADYVPLKLMYRTTLGGFTSRSTNIDTVTYRPSGVGFDYDTRISTINNSSDNVKLGFYVRQQNVNEASIPLELTAGTATVNGNLTVTQDFEASSTKIIKYKYGPSSFDSGGYTYPYLNYIVTTNNGGYPMGSFLISFSGRDNSSNVTNETWHFQVSRIFNGLYVWSTQRISGTKNVIARVITNTAGSATAYTGTLNVRWWIGGNGVSYNDGLEVTVTELTAGLSPGHYGTFSVASAAPSGTAPTADQNGNIETGDISINGEFYSSYSSTWTNASISFNTNWANFDTSETTDYLVKYKRSGDFVYLRGALKRTAGTGLSTTAFTLPANFRPSKRSIHLSMGRQSSGSDAAYRVDFNADGTVTFPTVGTTAGYDYFSLAGIFFSVA